MRATDLVKRIWGAPPLATIATTATRGVVSQLSQLSQDAADRTSHHVVASVATVAGTPTPQNHSALPDLLARHGDASAHGVRWDTLELTDATASTLWVVLAPRGLTVLATTMPIRTPLSYAAAWPARSLTPEPMADAAPVSAEQSAVDTIARAMQSCWACRHLATLARLNDRTPACAQGHALVWRVIHPGRRTTPSRARDPTGACPDRAPPANRSSPPKD